MRWAQGFSEYVSKYPSYWRSRFRSSDVRTSLSDNKDYPAFCAEAAADSEIFATFRRAKDYSEILEHVSDHLGKRYLKVIRQDPSILAAAAATCASDTVGDPITFHYPGLGNASPTTLRYLKVAADLKRHFGSGDWSRILEIGVGYGGQCRVLCAIFPVTAYTMVDLPPVLDLTAKFLSASAIDTPISFISADATQPAQSDLLISNYAFSELRREVQEEYFEQFVEGAEKGYMTFNRISPRSFRSLIAEELAERVGGTVLAESPKSYPGNRVVVWGA